MVRGVRLPRAPTAQASSVRSAFAVESVVRSPVARGGQCPHAVHIIARSRGGHHSHHRRAQMSGQPAPRRPLRCDGVGHRRRADPTPHATPSQRGRNTDRVRRMSQVTARLPLSPHHLTGCQRHGVRPRTQDELTTTTISPHDCILFSRILWRVPTGAVVLPHALRSSSKSVSLAHIQSLVRCVVATYPSSCLDNRVLLRSPSPLPWRPLGQLNRHRAAAVALLPLLLPLLCLRCSPRAHMPPSASAPPVPPLPHPTPSRAPPFRTLLRNPSLLPSPPPVPPSGPSLPPRVRGRARRAVPPLLRTP